MEEDWSKVVDFLEIEEKFTFKVFVGNYKFKDIVDIWPDNTNIKNIVAETPPNLKFMMQDNNIIPFQLNKNNGRKYLIGNDNKLYEFDNYNIIVPGFYKDKNLYWEEITSLKDIKSYKKK
jgi:hypothetical protein